MASSNSRGLRDSRTARSCARWWQRRILGSGAGAPTPCCCGVSAGCTCSPVRRRRARRLRRVLAASHRDEDPGAALARWRRRCSIRSRTPG
jgi:hypothetical protein